MRYHRPCILASNILISCLYAVLPIVTGITVPTGKLTPIEPAEPSPASTLPIVPSPRFIQNPAPVEEYTNENPEPYPLDPSYVPVRYDYIQYLQPSAILYVPKRIKYPSENNYSQLAKLNEIEKQYKFGKFSKDKDGKLQSKLLEKYRNYPEHLQKKYIYYHLFSSNKQ